MKRRRGMTMDDTDRAAFDRLSFGVHDILLPFSVLRSLQFALHDCISVDIGLKMWSTGLQPVECFETFSQCFELDLYLFSYSHSNCIMYCIVTLIPLVEEFSTFS